MKSKNNNRPETGTGSDLKLFSDSTLSLEQQTIDDINLSPRSKNCLKEANIITISQLISLSIEKIKSIRGLSWRSIREIIDSLQELPVSDEVIISFKQAQTESFVEHIKTGIEELNINGEIADVLNSVGITTIGELLLYSEEELLMISQKQYEGVKSMIKGFGSNTSGKLLKHQIGAAEIEEIKSALLEYGIFEYHLASIEDIRYRMLLLEKGNDFTIEGESLFRINQKKYLATARIPAGITVIESNAFRDQPIKEVVIPEGVTEIKGFAFCNCYYLEKVLLPDSMRIIESSSFWPCPSIQKIVIPNDVQDCGDGSFDGCDYLHEIVMPARLLPKFVRGRYSRLPDTCQVIVSDLKDKLYGDFIIDSSKLIKYIGNESQAVIVVPDGINEISDGAFARSSIKSVSLPTSVNKIGRFAFWGCNNLEYVVIPESVQEIGWLAFDACFSLLEISLPRKFLPEIGKYGIRQDDRVDDCRITINDVPQKKKGTD